MRERIRVAGLEKRGTTRQGNGRVEGGISIEKTQEER